MQEQYLSIKEKHKDEILFFRLGDFYEMFYEDAMIASKELDLTITKRSGGMVEDAPMCGVPYHVCDTYISRLINKGYKVAICEQIEDPKLTKGIVKREVIKIITPGTFTDLNFLKNDENNFLMSIFIKENYLGICYSDFSTGEIYETNRNFIDFFSLSNYLRDEISRISPSEILINRCEYLDINEFVSNSNIVNFIEDIFIRNNLTDEDIKLINKDVVNFLDENLSNKSIIYLLKYLVKTQKSALNHINKVIKYNSFDYLLIDENSKRNLELTKGITSFNKSGSLLEILDKTKTSMGARELKKWIDEPLVDIEKINHRFNLIDAIKSDLIFMDDLRNILNEIYDIERLSVKISNKTISPRECISFYISLVNSKKLKNLLEASDKDVLIKFSKNIIPLGDLALKINNMIVDNPPNNYDEERFIKRGYSKELDELFELSDSGSNWLIDFENKERNRTGIKNLKVKYNKILGFFIDVTKSYVDLVPSDYIRKQTLVGSERYFSMELKDMEAKIIGSKDRALRLQKDIFNSLKEYLLENIVNIQNLSKIIAKVDGITSLAYVAYKNNYIRPNFNLEGTIEIEDGRHPIVENNFKNEFFVPNDTYLSKDKFLDIITGPNMAGKSTYMRQVAIIAIMAHIGSFVPCSKCNMSLLDKIYTRIGASDNLSKGESTFMVEMKEVANILKGATKNSLIILDEVGRGTSTFDGLSIAWALVEYIATYLKSKTLFATHYHELVEISKKYEGIKNLTTLVSKENNSIVFLRKIEEGFSSNSYGIEVAKLAGVNDFIINRASEVLETIQQKEENTFTNKLNLENHIHQENIFDLEKVDFIKSLKNININNLSPIEGLNLLNEIIKKAGDLS